MPAGKNATVKVVAIYAPATVIELNARIRFINDSISADLMWLAVHIILLIKSSKTHFIFQAA